MNDLKKIAEIFKWYTFKLTYFCFLISLMPFFLFPSL